MKVYLTDREYAEVAAAAEKADNGRAVSVSGYAASAALTFARRALAPELNPLREAVRAVILARNAVNRYGVLVNQAVAGLNATGRPPAWLAEAVATCSRATAAAEEAMRELRKTVPR